MKQTKRLFAVLVAVVMMVCVLPVIQVSTASAGTTNYQVGDIIEFGSYPQTRETDSGIISALNNLADNWQSYRYYSGTSDPYDTGGHGRMTAKDYMMYCNVNYGGNDYRGVRFTQYRPYSTDFKPSAAWSYQDDNGYEINTTYWFKYESLQWKILDPSKGLVMCNSIIDSQPYNNYLLSPTGGTGHWGNPEKTIYASDYTNSSLRKWLNETFYETSFTPEQQNKIAINQNQNNDGWWTLNGNMNYTELDSDPTNDKIFLLSSVEVLNPEYGFSSSGSVSDTARMVKGTDYAKCQGLRVISSSDITNNGNSWWMLRTPGTDSKTAKGIDFRGTNSSVIVNWTDTGIRPAMCIEPDFLNEIEKPESYSISLMPNGDYVVDDGNLFFNDSGNYIECDKIINSIQIKNNRHPLLAIQNTHLKVDVTVSNGRLAINETSRVIDETIKIPFGETFTRELTNINKTDLLDFMQGGTVQIDYSIELVGTGIFGSFEAHQTFRVNVSHDIRNAVFPEGYSFLRDSYNFKNFGGEIALKYFQTMFGDGRGLLLWRKKSTNGGHCFGMSYTTAAMINGLPNCSSIRSLNLNNDVIEIGHLQIKLIDYIRYAQIWQWSSNWVTGNNWTSVNEIYNRVLSYLSDNRIGVVITMRKKSLHSELKPNNAHAVLAIGIDGNRILIDDPMNKESLEYIEIEENGDWEYSFQRSWNSKTCDICCSEDYDMPYSVLSTGKTVVANDDGVDGMNYIIEGIEAVDSDKLLLTAPKDSVIDNDEKIELFDVMATDESSTNEVLYWIPKNSENKINLSSDEEGEHNYSLANDSIVLSVTTTDSSSVTLNADKSGKAYSSINATIGNHYMISEITFDQNGNPIDVIVSGIANDNTVMATQTESGILVNGLNDIIITYSEDNEIIAETTVNVTDGREVTIQVNEDAGSIEATHEHDYASEITTPASCTQEGVRTFTCTICGDTYTEPVGKTAHTLTTINQRDATYDAEGYTGDQYCTTCQQTITTGTAIPKLVRPTDPQPQPSGGCKWCGKTHGGAFGWLVKLFHNLFAAIFGARY